MLMVCREWCGAGVTELVVVVEVMVMVQFFSLTYINGFRKMLVEFAHGTIFHHEYTLM